MLLTQNRARKSRPFEPFAGRDFDRTKHVLVITTSDGGTLYGTADENPTSEIFQEGVLLHDAWKNGQEPFKGSIIYTPGHAITSIGFANPGDLAEAMTTNGMDKELRKDLMSSKEAGAVHRDE